MFHRRLAVLVLTGLFCGGRASAQQTQFSEDFSAYPAGGCLSDGATFGPWSVVFTGYGCVKIGTDGANKWLDLDAYASKSPLETHALLVSGPSFTTPLSFQSRVVTVAQARTGSPPNAWEVGWVLWDYADNDHFYYLILKTIGWELGKRDPAYPGGQRFLATGSFPAYPLGVWATVRITQDAGNVITVYSDGRLVTTFTDVERPYSSGKVGVYNEDAHSRHDDISVVSGAAAPPAAAAAPGCLVSGPAWQNSSFAAQSAPFTASFDAVPGMARMDGVTGLSLGAASGYTSMAAAVRFNNVGTIDARNGGVYAAAAPVPYVAGAKYRFRLAVDPAAHVYSAYVTPPGGLEQVLGTNYAFRTEQAATSSLNNWTLSAGAGSHRVCGFTATPAPVAVVPVTAPVAPTTCQTSSLSWQNRPFAAQAAPFTASFDAVPGKAAMDGLTGMSLGAASGFTSMAVAVRFNGAGYIDVRNGGAYAAAAAVPYSAGARYRFRLTVDPAAHRYSVYVTPPGKAEIALATNYAFRAEQAATSRLDNWTFFADSGAHQVCGLAP